MFNYHLTAVKRLLVKYSLIKMQPMNIIESRRKRLAEWFETRPIPEKEKSYISQLINGKASFGEKAALRLERDYGMPERYLVQPNATHSEAALSVGSGDGKRRLRQVDLALMDGAPYTGRPAPAVLRLTVSAAWVQKHFHFTSIDNLRLAYGDGDSMDDTFGDGDPLLVDIGENEVRDGVYVLGRGDDIFVKRVQRDLSGNFLIISDNKAYETIKVTSEEWNGIRVHARVLHAWNGWKLA